MCIDTQSSPQVSVVIRRDEEHRATAHDTRHNITEKAFLHDEDAGAVGTAEEFMAGEEDGVFRHKGLFTGTS